MFHYTVYSSKSPKQVITDLTSNLQNEKFGVLWKLDLKKKLDEKGVDFERDYHILEVCNPEEAKRVLTESPLVGYFLPCKIVIYEENGNTSIGMPKPTELIDLLGNEKLMEIADDIEKRLISCVDQSK